MTNGKRLYPGVGVSSILMIFLVLCLTSFGVLSLFSARSDWNLTRKNRESVLNYYAADAKVQQVLRQIDAKLREPGARANPADVFDGLSVEGTKLSVGRTKEIGFSIPVGDSQRLEVSVLPEASGQSYRITRYRLAAAGEWNGDDRHLEVWQG